MGGYNQVRIVLIGTAGSEFRLAAGMAADMGADVWITASFAEALERLCGHGADLVMIDVALDVAAFITAARAQRLSVPVLGCGIGASAERAVAAIRAGAYDYIPLPPQRDLIAAAILSLGRKSTELLGEDPGLQRAVELALAFAPSPAPLLVTGEAGTGKEMIARRIHQASGRPGPFLAVECAGVAPELLEAELFGYQAGAFPGATCSRAGRLAEAAGGTLLLRNVDTLGSVAQARIAATLSEAGPADPALSKARLIATTSADLSARVSDARFRADLLARLSMLRIDMPPLRTRGTDIALLAEHFSTALTTSQGLPGSSWAPEALALLGQYDWPGNVRELEDVVHRAVLLAARPVIGTGDIVLNDGARIVPAAHATEDDLHVEPLVGHTLDQVERELILHTLERCGGNRTSASVILGISVRTMRNKLKSFIEAGIPVAPAL